MSAPWSVYPPRFIKRSGIVEAVQFDGQFDAPEHLWLRRAIAAGKVVVTPGERALIYTPRGQMWLMLGDWLLLTSGGLFPMKAEYFARDYIPDWPAPATTPGKPSSASEGVGT